MSRSTVGGSRDEEKSMNFSSIQEVELTGSNWLDVWGDEEGWMENDLQVSA